MSYIRKTFAVIATCLGLLPAYPAFSFGPYTDGTNPYVVAVVHLRADQTTKKDDLLVRIEMLEKKYGASWDGQMFRNRGPNLLSAGPPSAASEDVAIRISLHRMDVSALSRESGVAKVETIAAFAF